MKNIKYSNTVFNHFPRLKTSTSLNTSNSSFNSRNPYKKNTKSSSSFSARRGRNRCTDYIFYCEQYKPPSTGEGLSDRKNRSEEGSTSAEKYILKNSVHRFQSNYFTSLSSSNEESTIKYISLTDRRRINLKKKDFKKQLTKISELTNEFCNNSILSKNKEKRKNKLVLNTGQNKAGFDTIECSYRIYDSIDKELFKDSNKEVDEETQSNNESYIRHKEESILNYYDEITLGDIGNFRTVSKSKPSKFATSNTSKSNLKKKKNTSFISFLESQQANKLEKINENKTFLKQNFTYIFFTSKKEDLKLEKENTYLENYAKKKYFFSYRKFLHGKKHFMDNFFNFCGRFEKRVLNLSFKLVFVESIKYMNKIFFQKYFEDEYLYIAICNMISSPKAKCSRLSEKNKDFIRLKFFRPSILKDKEAEDLKVIKIKKAKTFRPPHKKTNNKKHSNKLLIKPKFIEPTIKNEKFLLKRKVRIRKSVIVEKKNGRRCSVLFPQPVFTAPMENDTSTISQKRRISKRESFSSLNKNDFVFKTKNLLHVEKANLLPMEQLFFNITENNLEEFKQNFLLLHVPIEKKDSRGYTLLNYAAKSDHYPFVEFLIQKGADVNTRDKEGDTPLHFACKNKNYDIIDLLLKRYAKENAKNNKGKTPYQCL